jgi:UDP-2,4-diacetamido-2,4,6-trideoxy-beta-L-altropyranose hydrolase
MNILFRADSSSIIGTGHIMRDLVLAEQFKDANIIFATQDFSGNINYKVEEKDYKIEILDSNSIMEVIKLVDKYRIDMIVIDNYNIDCNYEKELNEKTDVKIFVLDDTYEKHYCDILLNHNVTANATKYIGLVPKNCELRCGAKYTLLRNEFNIIKKTLRDISGKDALTVFIAMGGTDHTNKNIDILKVVNKFGNIKANVVTTRANRYLKELEEYVKEYENITIHINTDKIASLMKESDFAIVTPSVTVNEVIFMRLPFIAIQTADNQNEIAQYLEDHNFQILRSYDTNTLVDALKTVTNKKHYSDILNKINVVLKSELN